MSRIKPPPATVPIAMPTPSGVMLLSSEWQRLFEAMAQRINELEARIVALGG